MKFIDPAALPKIPGYSHVAVTAGGTTVYISGQLALDEHARLVGPGDVELQADQVFRNLEAALHAVGGTLANVVKLTTYLINMKDIGAFRASRARFMNAAAAPPASTLVEVSALADRRCLIEIEAIAWLPE